MKKLLPTMAAALMAVTLPAQETPLWLRKAAISPDGTKIAFSYKNDIYVVSSDGGRATQLTSNSAYDSDPMWAQDSRHIVFRSQRDGSNDIYMTTTQGGSPKRLTDYPGSETPLTVLPDGRVIFSSYLGVEADYTGFPGSNYTYIVDTAGHAPKLFSPIQMEAVSVSADGKLLYEDYKGYEDPLRKHHTSSVTRDIWLCEGASLSGGFKVDADATFTKLTSFKGEDRNPVFAADGDTFYYLSEEGCKNINLFRSSVSDPSKRVQLTFEEKNPVRHISVAKDGTIAYSLNGELYTLKEGRQPKKVEISVFRDDDQREAYNLTVTSGIRSFAVSPDGKEVAVAIRGDIFVTSEDYKTTRRITNTPQQERDVCFSEDGRSLYYSAERDGCWGVYRATLKDKDDKHFTYGGDFTEELFSEPGVTSFYAKVSPDGKEVAYMRDRTEIVVRPSSGGKVRSVLPADCNYSYSDGDQDFEWSPDSRYLFSGYQANGGWNNVDICLIEVESGEITNLTESGYSDASFRWALGGKAMTFESDKDGYRSHGSWGAQDDIYVMFFDGKAMTEFLRDKEDAEIAKILTGKDEEQLKKEEKRDSVKQEKKPEKLVLDLANRESRTFRLTSSSAFFADYFLSPDGDNLYYISDSPTGMALFVKDLKKGDVRQLVAGVYGSIVPSKDGKDIYVVAGSSITKVNLAAGSQTVISVSGEFEFKPAAERQYMFEHIWKQVKEKFYDPGLHGADWDYCHDNYARFVPYVNNNYDFADILSEMLGELNGSHTGARAYATGLSESPSYLGFIQDWDYEGDGIRIKEVLPDGALNLADTEIKAGDIIESIDGHGIKAGEAWYSLLSRKAGKKVAITVSKGGKKAVKLYVEPKSSDYTQLYKRWVRRNEALVSELSGGKVGYVHVEGMDSPSFREVYSKALGKWRACDALIVDTRHNGGGWLHDDLATFLSGVEYVRYTPRGQYIGSDPYNKWTKKSCVLMSEDNYSDASGFPYIYQALGIGKLIGTSVPGTMTAVWWETQINPSIVFGIPEVGSWAIKEGRYEENQEILPDIEVHNAPAETLKGEDRQLKAAVEEMLKEISK